MITFLRFGRAHTLIGTTLSLLAVYLIATRQYGIHDWGMFAWSLFVCLAANVYITGLNQLTDVEIDRINKPYLPLASGAYTIAQGRWIVGVCGVLAVIGSLWYPPYLPLTVLSSIALGTAYSADPIRLKRFHFWAAFCIIVVRGLIVNLILYLHYAKYLGEAASVPPIPPTIWLLTAVIFVFGVIIAWYKDLPDTEGDDAHGIRTLSLIRSKDWVYRAGAILLSFTLLVAGAYALAQHQYYLGGGLIILLVGFGVNTRSLDLTDQASIARFYQGTWVVFFGIYLVFAVFG
ncbi:homogentisate phytyltransferase [Lewinella sp. 4G2]|uniref:homogentisate phytyltransferase n=1 Tax=Lewinella sp. 4G2 TaxID=1803372 RepID=UPI0007B4C5BE|nr:homogentisate phytyltransferase [Lewinella sp. 4G2]OAV45336.1 hypothetical protein A3850_012905 [Lewinella sp. 4G2]